MFAFGVFGKDGILEQLGCPCDKDMPCGLIGVRLGVAKFEIWGVEVRVGLEERRRIMASGFIILKKRFGENIYGALIYLDCSKWLISRFRLSRPRSIFIF